MKTTYLFIMALLLFTSCSEDDVVDVSENDDIEGNEEFKFYESRSIRSMGVDFATIEDGGNLVFEYFLIADENPSIADDEYSERIIFEILPDTEEFSFSDDDLINSSAFFDKYCFCLIEGSIPITEGVISGTKLSNTEWQISIDISFEDFGTQTRTLSERFVLATRS